MTVTIDPAAPPAGNHPQARAARSDNGGMPARRAMVRWAWRMLRREWRTQAYLVALLVVAIAAAVCGTTALDNAPATTDPLYGNAPNAWLISNQDPTALTAAVGQLRAAYGTVDVIATTNERAPGLSHPVEYRSQALHGHFTSGTLAITQGRYPSGASQASITSGLAASLGLRLGATIDLDGRPRTIVGIAENPSKLSDAFVLVAPGAGPPPASLRVLVGGSLAKDLRIPNASRIGIGPRNDQLAIVTLSVTGTTIALLLVSFVAAAGFAALAHRRLRQLGMLTALGATDRHLRLVMTATGALIGTIGVIVGAALGLVAWIPVSSWVQSASGHRVDVLHLPWLLLAGVALLGVVMPSLAAWWPSRRISRLPATVALSGRPPVPLPARRSAALALVLLAGGVAAMFFGGTRKPPLVIAGTVCTAVAMLLAAPIAIRALAHFASGTPVSVRLALRDLVRHQARSGAAVAAISLAIGIPVATTVIATATQPRSTGGNLSNSQVLVRLTEPGDPPDSIPAHSDAELTAMSAQIQRMLDAIPGATAIPLDEAGDPSADAGTLPSSGLPAAKTLNVAEQLDAHSYLEVGLYVATPQLLRLVGATPGSIPRGTEVLTSRDHPIVTLTRDRGADAVPLRSLRVPGARYSSLPDSLLTSDGLAARHLTRVRAGWLIETPHPVTSKQLSDARHLAAGVGLTIESRDSNATAGTVRSTATAIGLLVALAVLALTVGLVRSEGAADLRTLTATGATSRIRRTVTATTAGALALLGVLLGTAGAVAGLMAVYRHRLGVFTRVPPIYPLLILVALPLVAATGGWLLAGRPPPAISRRLSD